MSAIMIVGLLILAGVLIIIFFLFGKNEEKAKTHIVLIRKYEGENFHISKTFSSLMPPMNTIRVCGGSLNVTHSELQIEGNRLLIFAEDLKKDWKKDDIDFLKKNGWEISNIWYFFPKEQSKA